MAAFEIRLCRRRKYSFTKHFGVCLCSKLHLQLHVEEAIPHYKEAPGPGQASSLGAPGPQTVGFSHPPVSEAMTTEPLPESRIWGAWCGQKQNQTQSSWREVRQVLPPSNFVSLWILPKSNDLSEILVPVEQQISANISQEVLCPVPDTFVNSLPHAIAWSHQLSHLLLSC